MKESTTFHAGCKILASALVCISSCLPFSAFANVFDYSNSGIVKASSGAYYLVEGRNVTQISAEKAMSMQYKFPVNTTRGAQEVAFVRQATPYIPKIGAAVTSLAKRVGPLGMALSATDLVCSLSNICNQAGQWMFNEVNFSGSAGNYPTCEQAVGYPSSAGTYSNCENIRNQVGAGTLYWWRSPDAPAASAGCVFFNATGYSYVGRAYQCTTPPTTSNPVSDTDWTNAETKLNDARFVDELASKNEQIPINLPAMTSSPLRQLVSDVYDPQFNSSGTQTGTKRTQTELVVEDVATTDKPNQINVKEEATTTYYDNTGNVVGTITKSTTEVSQQTPQPAQQLCGLPGQDPCNVLIDERGVQTAIAALDPLGQTATNNVTAAFDSANNSILSRSGGVGSGMAWPWQVNAGSCSPLVIDAQKGLILDPCPHIPLIHQILGYVFYVLTAIAIFNVFFQPKTA